ncbi:hypothetical protein B5P45_09175 [Phyllobacterium zundukense]|uniref:Uncharacterized protein n=1 Tax=Phyllobacterium zundukense TaxID=1867719 RepID=A0A2N9W0D1_9HYPH|nr:hypothetical protein BLM14_01985 [Phyllobacterium zundukense]PIO45199.1 hypothetical protein B5P45_09175 [Phyllobacterium zundukense]
MKFRRKYRGRASFFVGAAEEKDNRGLGVFKAAVSGLGWLTVPIRPISPRGIGTGRLLLILSLAPFGAQDSLFS